MSFWINFKEMRASLDFEKVMQYYKVEVNRKGDQHQGCCPLPNHGPKRSSKTFSANLKRGVFHCFGCGAKGNVLDFAVLMEGGEVERGSTVRRVARQLIKAGLAEPGTPPSEQAVKVGEKSEEQRELPILVNPPLNFELKGLDTEHEYVKSRGFNAETIAHFGLGYCERGMLKGRVAIPLHDQSGQRIGYAGRVVDDNEISESNPRYRLPGSRERDGKFFEFKKSLFVYNGHRISEPVDDLIVVEGFTGVWWLHQHGYPQTVAVMGNDCSVEQSALIASLVKPGGRVWVMPDGDEAGERCAVSILRQVSPHRSIRWVKLADGAQPTSIDADGLKAVLW